MGEDRRGDGDRAETKHRYTVSEAAAVLGTTSEGVRSRIKRGTLEAYREGGRVFVILEGAPPRTNAAPPSAPPGDRAELVDELRERVQFLEGELGRRGDETAELRRIIAALTQRIPEIEAPQEPRESPLTPSEPVPNTETPPEPERPWWRRMFGV